jgi:hypothetical protein
MKKIITILIILGLVILGYALLRPKPYVAQTLVTTYEECVAMGYPVLETYPEQCKTPNGTVFVKATTPVVTDPIPVPTTKNDLIKVTNPVPNQLVSSPLTITGSARGNWYFEGSFPVEILDANGKQLAIKPAQAQGEWMTTNFVPFSVTLTFAKPTTATGTIVLHKDNPSDESKFDDELRIPVRFSTNEQTVKLYYYNSNNDKDAAGNILCSSKGLVAVTRTIPVTQTPIQDVLRLLLKGELATQEKSAGITTDFPLSGVSLTGASLTNGTLTLSISDPNHKTSGGACRVAVLKAQVEATAKQFDSVKTVRFSPTTVFQP